MNESFETLIVSAYPRLYRYALRLTTDSEKADDLTQDTVLRALEGKDSFVMGTNFVAWVNTIMYHIFINNCRKNRDTVSLDGLTIQIAEATKSNDYTDLDDIKKAFQTIPQKSAKALKMYADGYSYEEIRDKLCIPMGTVKSRIRQARLKLCPMLQEYLN